MCGIVGVLDTKGTEHPQTMREKAGRMIAEVQHRGPDGSETWVQRNGLVAFGFCRLAIVDLTSAGMQPMHSSCGRYTLVFNGEIYNHSDLRLRLSKKTQWRGRSDTESLLELISDIGIAKALPLCEGMFGLACYDELLGELTLARDRFGEKSVYYAEKSGFVFFSSELRPLDGMGLGPSEVDPKGVAAYLRHTYIPSPQTIWKGVRKLLPAEIRTWRIRDGSATTTSSRYWDLVGAASASMLHRGKRSEAAIQRVEEELTQSVKVRMIADVPVGVFLSGGVDSSLLAWKATEVTASEVRAFTIAFPDCEYDESRYAKNVADQLGIQLTKYQFTESECLKEALRLSSFLDEPFADSSILPLSYLARQSRNSVKVALCGDGGDELFGGYGRYELYSRRMKINKLVPRWLRDRIPLKTLAELMKFFVSRRKSRGSKSARAVERILTDYASGDPLILYRSMTSFWKEPREIYDTDEDGMFVTNEPVDSGLFSCFDRAQLYDLCSYLPNEILVKTDRATMGAGLEARCPFLDTRVFDSAWRLTAGQKCTEGVGKVVLRDLLSKRFRNGTFDRPKAGFTVPVREWLRGPLRKYGEEIVFADPKSSWAILKREALAAAWRSHLSGMADNSAALWTAIQLERWLETALKRQKDASGYLLKRSG